MFIEIRKIKRLQKAGTRTCHAKQWPTPPSGVLSDEAEHTQGSNMGSMYQFLSVKCETRNVKEIPQ